jgi:hypothetical protein
MASDLATIETLRNAYILASKVEDADALAWDALYSALHPRPVSKP